MLRILVEASKIKGAVDEYDNLNNNLGVFRQNIETNDSSMTANNFGDYQDFFHEKTNKFTDGKLTLLEDMVRTSGEALENAHIKACGLIARCSDFAMLLNGESALGTEGYQSASTGGVDILLFEDQYCSEDAGFAGAIMDDTEHVKELCESETEDVTGINEAISHLQTINVNISGQISEINECITKQKRVEPLYNSLVEYGNGVKELNSYFVSTLSRYTDGYVGAKLGHYRNSIRNSYLSTKQAFLKIHSGISPYLVPQNMINPLIYDPRIKRAMRFGLQIAREELERFIKGFVPHYVDNADVVAAMFWLAILSDVSKETIEEHFENNKKTIISHYKEGQYIENQTEWGDVYYGDTDMAAGGCGVIAIMNAYRALGVELTPEQAAQIISEFEEYGCCSNGNFGTSSIVISQYLNSNGCTAREITTDDYDKIEELAEDSDTLIVMVYNDKDDVTQSLHYVNIEKVEHEDGTYGYIVHNGSCDPTIEFDSAEDAIKNVSTNVTKVENGDGTSSYAVPDGNGGSNVYDSLEEATEKNGENAEVVTVIGVTGKPDGYDVNEDDE